MHSPLLHSIAYNIYTKLNVSLRKVAECLQVDKSSVHRWLRNREIQPVVKGRVSSYNCNEPYCNVIRKYVTNNPNTRLKDLQQHLAKNYSTPISLSTICRYLRKMGFSWKKVSFQQYNNLVELKRKQKEFRKKLSMLNKKDIVSFDESYFYEQLHRPFGYSKIGTKCVVQTKVKGQKYTLLAAVSSQKVLAFEVLNKNANTDIFYKFLKTKLLPNCKNKTIILDNVAFHKSQCIKDLVERSGNELLFIPPYSPQFNPIEQVFHILKSQLLCMTKITNNDIQTCLCGISEDKLRNIYTHSLG
jgi:transposase